VGRPQADPATRWRTAPGWIKAFRRLFLPDPAAFVDDRVAQEVAQAFFFAKDQEAFLRVVRAVLVRECLTAYGRGKEEDQVAVTGDTSGGNRGSVAS
jgi:hypothetical protein